MDIGFFYFLSEDYFLDFPDDKLMKNKEIINGQAHNRPCFYSFYEDETKIYWLIPFSSKVDKYKEHHQKKINKYGECDTILFGNVLGYEKAFLIQNMCPVIPKYIDKIYIDNKSNLPVKVTGNFEKELIQKARKVLSLVRKGKGLIFPDVIKIEKDLIKKLEIEKQKSIKQNTLEQKESA